MFISVGQVVGEILLLLAVMVIAVELYLSSGTGFWEILNLWLKLIFLGVSASVVGVVLYCVMAMYSPI